MIRILAFYKNVHYHYFYIIILFMKVHEARSLIVPSDFTSIFQPVCLVSEQNPQKHDWDESFNDIQAASD